MLRMQITLPVGEYLRMCVLYAVAADWGLGSVRRCSLDSDRKSVAYFLQKMFQRYLCHRRVVFQYRM